METSPVSRRAIVGMIAIAFGLVGGPDADSGSRIGKRLPDLHVTEWIRNDPGAVAWGDGRIYLLDLWGTWCDPCIANIPALTKLQATYGGRGLVVIGYSWEKQETVRAFVGKMGTRMEYAVAADPEGVTLEQLTALEAVRSFPWAFLIDRDGKVVWEGHPEDDDLPGAVARHFAR